MDRNILGSIKARIEGSDAGPPPFVIPSNKARYNNQFNQFYKRPATRKDFEPQPITQTDRVNRKKNSRIVKNEANGTKTVFKRAISRSHSSSSDETVCDGHVTEIESLSSRGNAGRVNVDCRGSAVPTLSHYKGNITPVEKVETTVKTDSDSSPNTKTHTSNNGTHWNINKLLHLKSQHSPPPPYKSPENLRATAAITSADTMTGVNSKDDLKLTATWGALFYDFTQQTTFHGVRFTTVRTRFMTRRIWFVTIRWLWILITLAAFVIFMYYLYDRVHFYLSYQKSVNVEVNYVDEVEFPAVTICNQNQFKLTSAANGGYYPEVFSISQSLAATGILTCGVGEFQCDDKCISRSRACDGIADCHDNTDENTDTCGCIRMEIVGRSNSSLLNQYIYGRVFELDQAQRVSGRHMYYTANHSLVLTYLFYMSQARQWAFSTVLNPTSAEVLLHTEDPVLANYSDSPAKYQGVWTINTSIYSLEYNCLMPAAESQSMSALAKTKLEQITLTSMYNNGSHSVNDMIQSCTWKGQSCSASDFDVLDTDFGRCYRYMPQGPVEQPGPGFGLGITVNIQQYEYTKNTQDGVGVQVILHDPGEPPLMTEKAFAISPGLYTLVAVERTEVKNLAPPWGRCESLDLDYYPEYSASTCNLDCLNTLVRQKCECRDIYMPQKLVADGSTADYQECSVPKYIECWKPKLDEFRRYGNFCSCATPCKEVLYVPSLSFASITSDQDLLSGEDLQKMIKMRENLIEAREITYRIQADKYLESMRMFSTTIRQTIQTNTRLQVTTESIENELAQIRSITSEVNTDCLWFMAEQYKLVQLLKTKIQASIDDFYKTVREKLYFQIEQLYYVLQRIYACWDLGTCGYSYCMNSNCGGSCCCGAVCYHAQASTWRYLLNPWYITTKDIFQVIKNELRENLEVLIDTSLQDVTFPYRLSPERLSPLLPYLRTNCTWCLNESYTLAKLLRDRLVQSLDTIVIPNIESVESTLDGMHGSSFDNGNFLLSTSNRESLLTRVLDLAASANSSLQLIDTYLSHPVRQAIDITSDLLRLLTPKCGTELQKLYDEYTNEHNRMHSDIILLERQIQNYGEDFVGYQDLYRDYVLSLTQLHQTSGSEALATYIQGVNVTTESTFKDRNIALNRISSHIEVIYYWISSQVPDLEMAHQSLIWQRFDIHSPSFSVGWTEDGSGGIAIDQRQYLSHSSIITFWQDIDAKLLMAKLNLGIGVTEMLRQIDETHRYLSNFVAGNQISESFYQKNYLQLDIFYKELTERNIVQQKAYELAALLGEAGGLMGLLLGASVMTIIEFLDLIIYNGINKCIERRNKNTKQKDQQQTNNASNL